MIAGTTFLGSGVGRSLIQALGQDCEAGAALARRLEEGAISFTGATANWGFGAAAIERVSKDFEKRGWLVRNGIGWRRTDVDLPKGLSSFLSGAAAMRTITLAETESVAVVTLPAAPSRLAEVLPTEGPVHASMEKTSDEMARIARSAVSSITIMSPFVNRDGAEFAMRTFDESPAPQKTLITRLSGTTGRAVRPLVAEMQRRGIRVLDYFIRAGDGYETFHAKIVIADSDLAYIGSANMTLYDRHSMELGIIVRGKPARAVSALVRSVERISVPVSAT